jgi:energy-coupling factor transporter transmembrane protein EcfT
LNSARAAVIASCWFSLAIIASVYMLAFADKLGDIFYGVLIPIGLLVLAGIIVTFVLAENSEKQRNSL